MLPGGGKGARVTGPVSPTWVPTPPLPTCPPLPRCPPHPDPGVHPTPTQVSTPPLPRLCSQSKYECRRHGTRYYCSDHDLEKHYLPRCSQKKNKVRPVWLRVCLKCTKCDLHEKEKEMIDGKWTCKYCQLNLEVLELRELETESENSAILSL